MAGSESFGEFLAGLRRVDVPAGSPEVCATIAKELKQRLLRRARAGRTGPSLEVSVGRLPRGMKAPGMGERWILFDAGRRGRARLAASHAHYLYAFFTHLVENCRERPVAELSRGPREPSFAWQRPVWDLYFNQAARSVAGLDRPDYVRQMARLGFTHLEVNGLATPEGLEEGVEGEVYTRFYTYLPALDQFVDSFLNRGTYPKRYLAANLKRLKNDCRLAAKFGLTPAITCFEPRSVPESLLARYPELRGARVDHPFRSFKPRFNLAVSHPVVRRHYQELLRNLMREVPELGCMAVWTNDSGAGFEFTRSLYVGANGSAYLVREWSDPDVFVRSAARNVTDFLRLLQETGRETNKEFRVTTRLEPFVPERDAVLAGMGQGIDVEVASLFDRGWESPYRHPLYNDTNLAPFTIYNNRFDDREKPEIAKLAQHDCRAHVMYAHGPVNNFEPLLGLPAPWLTHEKLAALRDGGAVYLAHFGGVAPPSAVRWNLNEEIFRRFQLDDRIDIDETVKEIAVSWAGKSQAARMVRAWRLTDQAIRCYHPNPLYLSWNCWYRILTRPLVPDIEKIPERQRSYYEDHVLTTHHNPTRFDLRRDVLFDLMPPEIAAKSVKRIDRSSLPKLERAIKTLEEADAGTHELLVDQLDRLRALRCWMITNRNVAVWIETVHGYLDTKNRARRAAYRKRLREMIRLEIANAKELLHLWKRSKTVFMAVAEEKDTTFIHSPQFGDHLRRKIRLMERYGDHPPYIDPNVMWRVREKTHR